ncbi:MAG TPA: lysophospholipid transporter LplT [Steroidobacteraceae bacterium]|jgi:LPLT family lysophospholipid transporter-like MFS transporter|nr:lysophospholipid transporter LplT [Steroidobacteraceae bacterium]
MDTSVRPVPDVATLWSRGMIAVLLAQFLSAMADNALLFGALALLRMERYPAWTDPLLQEFFVGAYILLAPFVGPFADGLPKGRVMLIANGLKLLGALGMCIGLNPFVAYGLVGAGAAAYSPAKYGILAELVPAQLLVKANGLIESSTIAAILVGAIAGGTLADWDVARGLAIVTGCYAAAVAANLLIPRLPPAHPLHRISLGAVLRDFGRALKVLIRTPDTRFSMTGTSLFWGTGSTMRFLLVAWVPIALGITSNSMPAYLNAMVAVGIVIGAGLAAKFVALDRADRVLPAGVLIGVGVCILAATTHLPAAFAVMALIGACGGFFIVPLNALLQERGHRSVGAGHAIAVQNLAENGAMLLMIGLYTLAVHAGAAVVHIAAVFGAALSAAIALLWVYRVRSRARRA